MLEHEVDGELVRACAKDPKALAALFRAHGEDVRTFLTRICPRAARPEVEDLAQEVFMAVPRAARRYRSEAPPRIWLFGIARRIAKARSRRHAIRNALFRNRMEAVVPSVSTPDPVTGLDVERAWHRLSDTHREVLLLSVIEGLSAKEMARLFGVKEKTVWTRVHRARQALASLLDGEESLQARREEVSHG